MYKLTTSLILFLFSLQVVAQDTSGKRTEAATLEGNNPLINRPKTPKPPFNYYSEEITFYNAKDKITLAGTLTLPRKRGKFPVVIIISGSGPQNRDGEVFGHKPYWVIADYLTRNGIGVLRFDERGVEKSEGNFKTATIEKFASDVKAAITFLKDRKGIKRSKIGLIGHSLGGTIAPKVASESKDIKYIVLLAGPGVNGYQLLLDQKAAGERLMGYSESTIAQSQSFIKPAYDIIINSKLDHSALKDSLNSFYFNKLGNLFPEPRRKKFVNQITRPEVLSIIKSKPALYLAKVTCPVLALNGSKDFQVAAKTNLQIIKQTLNENGNNQVTTMELNNLNHLFQECETGALSEYTQIEQTISPSVLEIIKDWITKQTK